MMAAGRPVLVVPPKLPQRQILSHVLVAWRDSRESRRAVADAVPLLRKAEVITVMEIAEGGDEGANHRSVEDVANFIPLQGAAATPLVLPANDQSAADRLLEYAEANGAALIVLGGYGHARAREWIFGGVTRSMLKTSPICCLFSH